MDTLRLLVNIWKSSSSLNALIASLIHKWFALDRCPLELHSCFILFIRILIAYASLITVKWTGEITLEIFIRYLLLVILSLSCTGLSRASLHYPGYFIDVQRLNRRWVIVLLILHIVISTHVFHQRRIGIFKLESVLQRLLL